MFRQSGGWGLKNPLAWPLFFKYFRQFKETLRPSTFVIFAPRLYNHYNHAHTPGPHMWRSPGPWSDFKCSNRQWPKVSDLVARFCPLCESNTHGHGRITHETRAILACPCFFWNACDSRISVGFWLAQRAKKCDTNHIPRATVYAPTQWK